MIIKDPSPPRFGRPKSEEKRDAIRMAAGDLFLAQGLQRTSMDAVAAKAGVSKQTVYSHFKSKEDLFRAVITGKVADHNLLDTELPQGTDLRAALITMGHRYLELLFDDEVIAMFRVVIGESVSHQRIAQLFNETGPEKTIGALQEFLHKWVKGGALKIDDLRYAACLFLNMVRGEYHMQLLMNLRPIVNAHQMHKHVERSVDQFILLYAAQRKDS